MRTADDQSAEPRRFGERLVVMQRIHVAGERRKSANGINVERDHFRDGFTNAVTRIHRRVLNN
ncbi:hypothetical protein QZM22_07785 [Burkholderia oklahomensis]|nr:hypothetical protein [Burkholderia oklahomensis]MDN7672421.1 hypothetical protein [Burkholderia oklahomensis]